MITEKYHVIDWNTGERYELTESEIAAEFHDNKVFDHRNNRYRDIWTVTETPYGTFELAFWHDGVTNPIAWFNTIEEAQEELKHELFLDCLEFENIFITHDKEKADRGIITSNLKGVKHEPAI